MGYIRDNSKLTVTYGANHTIKERRGEFQSHWVFLRLWLGGCCTDTCCIVCTAHSSDSVVFTVYSVFYVCVCVLHM